MTPEGRPDTDRVMFEAYPPKGVLVTVELPLLPCTMEIEEGEAASV